MSNERGNRIDWNKGGGAVMPILTVLVNSKQLHIMLADDDEDDRENFIEAAHDVAPDIKITAEPDGVQLMGSLYSSGENVPDILFLDLNMPRKNGFECLDEIRNLPRFKSIPVVVYSTSSNTELINRTYDKGANLYIPKPQSFREIKKILKKILSLERRYYFPQPPKSKFVLNID